MAQNQLEEIQPFLTTLAVERTDSSDLPGRYCIERDLWVIDSQNGAIPIIRTDSNNSLQPVTKVQAERDTFAASALLEVSTKTSHQLERDDHSFSKSSYPIELVTKTNANREQDDTNFNGANYLPELLTKTDTIRERDDEGIVCGSYLPELFTKTETNRERDD